MSAKSNNSETTSSSPSQQYPPLPEETIPISYLTLPDCNPQQQKIPYRMVSPSIADPHTQSNVGGILFLSGFRSSMTSLKAVQLQQFCQQLYPQLGFVRFDYRGHSAETYDADDFTSLTMSDWISDASAMLQHCHQQWNGRPIIVVGSSMGGWIALHLALQFPAEVAGVMGIATAPDFLDDIQRQFTPAQQEELQTTSQVALASEYTVDDPFIISQKLLDDAKQWYLLHGNNKESEPELAITCPVRLVHGQQDFDISWQKSVRLAQAITHDNVHVTLIKSGQHRLSTKHDLDVLQRVLQELLDHVLQSQSSEESTT